MDFPLLPLAFNLALLGMALFICRTLNASQASLTWNGALIFLVLCIAAMLLDFTLTMVFASAHFHERNQYDTFGSRLAWGERIPAYLIPCAISLLLAWRFRRRQQFALGRTNRDERGTAWGRSRRRFAPIGIDALTPRE
ncbi:MULTISPECIES: hypothetical protein [Caballeronia]|uniref:hypothetical protein n=1 Tax=Caballeronia TaxID=1827195 RepID=UPI0002388316|nr:MULTISPECIES: hypothetical protein [unclassified Caballeronia]AET88846.1 hypothetical protein BYI23_A010080 [Burkholderia sp. YI23]MCE4542115.1 hypothetical protein [Caballeronia sp. PC1]MCE4568839.1 hypothetical protein [Caballeronia sp. CLC5]BAO86096.1 putative uncharacterized protein [Burkholderia sp. RPE67]